VKDEGIGIPEKDQARLFETFHRAANVTNISGTGLGLYITRLAVELHDGRITFSSKEGIGTVFTIYIPRSQPVEKK
jgi:signal transduction histidine kinase